MATQVKPKFCNELGVKTIRIGVREFECIGAAQPHDHPHIFLDMGDAASIICPYCSTLYELDPKLGTSESEPQGCLIELD